VRVRKAVPGDAVQIAEVERVVAAHPWSLSQVLNSCRSENHRVWVLESDTGAVAGFAVCQLVAGEASVLNIGVLPKYQGRGRGTALLRYVLRAVREMKARRCLLEVRCGNDRAIALYRKMGFTEDGVRRKYYPTDSGREDALLMSLDLAVAE
jgi:ribosomal-protein-alanine N-acetyltransferase